MNVSMIPPPGRGAERGRAIIPPRVDASAPPVVQAGRQAGNSPEQARPIPRAATGAARPASTASPTRSGRTRPPSPYLALLTGVAVWLIIPALFVAAVATRHWWLCVAAVLVGLVAVLRVCGDATRELVDR